ncbi:alanine racemase [Micromonospora sp. CPCC 206061]|uniref:alanine racemase n=1 Tax=Micromonospora sp. CPCC 206061 TaxID=3122410 RepID=UPI002FF11179
MPPDRVRAALTGAVRPVCAYVYDREVLRSRAATLKAALPSSAEVLYAVKANGHPDVVATLAAATDGLEVASGGELALARAAGARRIAFGGPAKTDASLRAAVAAGALVHVESALELHRLSAAADVEVSVALRVNRRDGGLPGSHQMAGAPTPFGIDEAQLPGVVALARALPHIRLVGFHLHAVSNNLDGALHAAFVASSLRWSAATASALGIALEYVNVGGGFGVDYTGTATFDTAPLAGLVPPDGVRLVFEPGRWLAADAGWYAAEVLDLKHTHGRWFAVLRGGTHHFRLPAAWGYSHPFTVLPVPDWPHPYPRPCVQDAEVDAVGELCTPRDVLTRGQRVDRLRVGDILVFGRAGAYGWDISHHEFLRHPHPQILVV